jgi:hypothetical protein
MNTNSSIGAGRMFFGDAIIAFLLVNEARRRIVMRVFGVSREDANPVTVVAAGTLAGGVHAGAARVLSAAVPSVAAVAIGAAALKEATHTVAGESSRSTPVFEALLAFAVLGTVFGPAVRGSFHGAQGAFRGFVAGSRKVGAFLGGH